MEESIVVSVIIPVKNGGHYFRLCLDSLLLQDFLYNWEISVYDDGSTDNEDVIGDYLELFQQKGVNIVLNRGEKSLGVGYAKNRAVRASSGKYLCFCDADDISYPSRISEQYKSAIDLENKFHTELLFLGCKFIRHPEHSTKRYTDWANSIDPTLLKTQIYTSHGPTLIAPTWFISRKLYDFLDGFREFPIGFPEDLEFFYRCIDTNCAFHRVEKCLVMYRYHLTCTSLGVSEDTIWKMRIERLATEVLERWNAFTIWNAGKQGKRFFKSLNNLQQQKVVAFCDVDSKKINRGVYEIYDDVLRCVSNKIPIIDVKKAVPPVIVCVKLDMSGGQLEELLAFTGWKEGHRMSASYFHPDEQKFVDTALELVKHAGRVIREAYEQPMSNVATKSSATDLVTETDQAVETMLISGLSKAFPDHKFIGEESVANGAKIEWTDSPTWIIDPIDGTTNFVHRIPMIAVCVGLTIKKQLRAGIVYNPITHEMFFAQAGRGAFKNGFPIHASRNTVLSRAVLSHSNGIHNYTKFGPSWLDKTLLNQRRQIEAGIRGHRSFGSAAINIVMVAQGSCDGFVEYGLHCWDVAAASLILLEAGGVIIDPTGSSFNLMSRKILCAGTAELAKSLSEILTHAEYEPEA